MVSRKGSLIAVAESKSANLIGGLDEKRIKSIANFEAIRQICRALLQRATPLRPTATLVSEEGKNLNADFPSSQTIFNTYAEMLKIWSKAYSDVVTIDASDPISADDVRQIDLSVLDSGTRFVVEELQRHIQELTQRCNALKRIIRESVPVTADSVPESADRMMDDLSAWLKFIVNGAVFTEENGLQVSRRTPVGTRIMDAALFNELRTFVDDYQSSKKRSNSL